MAKELAKLFNEVLIVPLDEDYTDCLEELYGEVVDDEDFYIDDCIQFFIVGGDDPVKDILQQLYENKYGDILVLPEICYLLYAQYIVYWYICHDVEQPMTNKLSAALLVRCLMVLHRERKGQMASMLYIEEMTKYIEQVPAKALQTLNCTSSLDLLGQTKFSQEQLDDPSFFQKMKWLAVKAAKYEFELLKNRLINLDDSSPYLKAYNIALGLAKVSHWEYVLPNPEKTINSLLDKYKSNKMLSTIKRDMEQTNAYRDLSPKKDTSILLRYMYGESHTELLERQKFTPAQFAQHLFYEFLSENS